MVVSINARACGYFGDRIQVTKMAVTRNIEFDSIPIKLEGDPLTLRIAF